MAIAASVTRDERKFIVTVKLTYVPIPVTFRLPARQGRLPEWYAARRSRYGARARTYHPLPGGFGSSARPALRPVREKHRCTETGKLRGKPDGGLIPGSAELKPGSGVRSPKPEPWWNADRRAAPEAPAGGNIGRRGAEE